MKRARVTSGPCAAIAQSTEQHPDGFYRVGDHLIRTTTGFFMAPGAYEEAGEKRPTAEWPATQHRIEIDGVPFRRSLIAAAEEIHGPLAWARSKAPVAVGAGARSHVAIGFQSVDSRTALAMVAPAESENS